MSKHVYADNAATTPLSRKAFEAMTPYLLTDYGNASQPYSFARSSKKALKEARAIIADCIGALPEEIYFTSGGTESDNWVIQGAIHRNMPVITTPVEHHAILHPCKYAASIGHSVKYLPVDKTGTIHEKDLDNNLMEAHQLVSVMFANNEIGTIEPIQELVSVAHNKGALFHTDAVQAVGHIPIHVKSLGVDMLSASAHKFNGPKGVGFLYIKKGIEWPSLLLGGAQEQNYRAGTENVASIIGMAIALRENTDTLVQNQHHLASLEKSLLQKLSAANIDFKRNGSDNHLPGNMSLSFKDMNGEALLHRLDLSGISVSTGSACDSKNPRISHVLQAIGLEPEYAKGTIRISLSKANTEEDVCKIAEALGRIIKSAL